MTPGRPGFLPREKNLGYNDQKNENPELPTCIHGESAAFTKKCAVKSRLHLLLMEQHCAGDSLLVPCGTFHGHFQIPASSFLEVLI